MKKLITICLLLALAFTVKAQDGKPTKEQTMEYIKGYYSDFKVGWWINNKYETYSENYKITIIGTKLIIARDEYSWDRILTKNNMNLTLKILNLWIYK